MHKSLALYASALKCTAGQIRRHIRAGLLPSAKLVKGRTGRPGWVIEDTSPAAIKMLRIRLENVRPVFCEPAEITRIEDRGNGEITVSHEICWRESYTPPLNDNISALFDLADRAALYMHGLTPQDLINPPVYYPDKWHCVVWPPHERKVQAYYRTQGRLLYALFKPRKSYTKRWVRRLIRATFRKIDIMLAARQLAIYHKEYGVKIGHETLAKVLGISKSSLYRTYDKLVREALCIAHKHARSDTQLNQHERERADHPGSRLETAEQSRGALRTQDSLRTKFDEDERDYETELQGTTSEGSPRDLPFELLHHAAIQIARTGEPLNPSTLTRYLRQRGMLTSSEHVSQIYSAGVINSAIVAARTTATA
jgi:hypothetical protein